MQKLIACTHLCTEYISDYCFCVPTSQEAEAAEAAADGPITASIALERDPRMAEPPAGPTQEALSNDEGAHRHRHHVQILRKGHHHDRSVPASGGVLAQYVVKVMTAAGESNTAVREYV
jgi:hypothetical protein